MDRAASTRGRLAALEMLVQEELAAIAPPPAADGQEPDESMSPLIAWDLAL